MSERKSWDVQRKPRAATPAAPATPSRKESSPARRVEPIRPRVQPTRASQPQAAPKRQAQSRASQEESSRGSAVPAKRRKAMQPAGALAERRKKQRRFARYLSLVIFLVLFAGAVYAVWLPSLRITTVSAQGPDADVSKTIAEMKLSGTYWHVLPRNSLFFYPQKKIRSAILDAEPDVSAVSITRTSFSSLAVQTTSRAAAFQWCGTTPNTPFPGGCFNADVEGLLFSQNTEATTSTSTPRESGSLHVFSALDTEITEGQSPIRTHIAYASRIPNALKFVDAIRTLGAPVSALSIQGDEADLWISNSTRIMYVLGNEEEAATLAASVLPTLNLNDPTIEYIDLRFNNSKAYVKHYGDQ